VEYLFTPSVGVTLEDIKSEELQKPDVSSCILTGFVVTGEGVCVCVCVWWGGGGLISFCS